MWDSLFEQYLEKENGAAGIDFFGERDEEGEVDGFVRFARGVPGLGGVGVEGGCSGGTEGGPGGIGGGETDREVERRLKKFASWVAMEEMAVLGWEIGGRRVRGRVLVIEKGGAEGNIDI